MELGNDDDEEMPQNDLNPPADDNPEPGDQSNNQPPNINININIPLKSKNNHFVPPKPTKKAHFFTSKKKFLL